MSAGALSRRHHAGLTSRHSFADAVSRDKNISSINIRLGDENCTGALLDAADAYIAANGTDLPEEAAPHGNSWTARTALTRRRSCRSRLVCGAGGMLGQYLGHRLCGGLQLNVNAFMNRAVLSISAASRTGCLLPACHRAGDQLYLGRRRHLKHIADHIATRRKYGQYKDASQR